MSPTTNPLSVRAEAVARLAFPDEWPGTLRYASPHAVAAWRSRVADVDRVLAHAAPTGDATRDLTFLHAEVLEQRGDPTGAAHLLALLKVDEDGMPLAEDPTAVMTAVPAAIPPARHDPQPAPQPAPEPVPATAGPRRRDLRGRPL